MFYSAYPKARGLASNTSGYDVQFYLFFIVYLTLYYSGCVVDGCNKFLSCIRLHDITFCLYFFGLFTYLLIYGLGNDVLFRLPRRWIQYVPSKRRYPRIKLYKLIHVKFCFMHLYIHLFIYVLFNDALFRYPEDSRIMFLRSADTHT